MRLRQGLRINSKKRKPAKASALLLCQVLLQPVQEMFIIILSGSNTENQADQFFIGIGKFNMVDIKKREHGMCADSLVPIHKWMILNKP